MNAREFVKSIKIGKEILKKRSKYFKMIIKIKS